MSSLLIHRHAATTAGTPVNAYVIESPEELVVVDATLTVDDGCALRERVAALGKPLAGVVITHAHPDHYGGLVELLAGRDSVPVHATQAVIDAIVRDDSVKEQILRPMFGDQWAPERAFPDTPVADGDTLKLGQIALRVTDLGPGESPADSVWALSDGRVFSGDLAYDRHHCYLADGFHQQWLANLERMRADLPERATLYPGHGLPCGLEVLDWQRGYIETMLDAIGRADWGDRDAARAQVAARMRAYLPTEALAFLMELSIEPLAPQAVTG
ncbi:MAG TPA: MBL fold metallo-hydrolase [Solirubrobacter sp.]|nr:MBL fold metallo-hydrolase [Solirubrobacter sp.]